MSEIVNVRKLAEVLNLSERRIQQLVKKDIIPTPEKGKYLLIESIKAYINYLQNLSNSRIEEIHLQKLRLLTAQAEKTEIEVEEYKKNLIPADQIALEWTNLITAFRAKILSLPHKIAPQVIAITEFKEAEAIIKEYVYEALIELSQYDPQESRCSKSSKTSRKAGRTST